MLEDFVNETDPQPATRLTRRPVRTRTEGGRRRRVEVTDLAEAALVLAVWRGSARMLLAVLRLWFYVVLLKPAQNKVPEEPGQQQNSERG